jgi:membrane protease YdiL (CAAX protease family)
VPGRDRKIREIYSLRELEPAPLTAFRLVAVVAPGEELFWRGFIHNALARRFGRWRGAALTNLAYMAAHVPSGNLVLVGAAGVAGAHWSALRAAGAPMGALIVSHSAWDVWIFPIQPTSELAGPNREPAGRKPAA